MGATGTWGIGAGEMTIFVYQPPPPFLALLGLPSLRSGLGAFLVACEDQAFLGSQTLVPTMCLASARHSEGSKR